MDNNTLVIIAVAAVGGIVIGAIIGYLVGGRKDTGLEAEKAAAEAKAGELEKQVKQKEIELSRRDDDIRRKQEEFVAADRAKTEAVTMLNEAHSDIAELREQLESIDLERVSYQNAHTAAEKKSVELQAKNEAILEQLEEQKQFLKEADQKLREAFESLSSEALRKNNASFIELANERLDEKVKDSATELETRKTAIETLVKPLGESLSKFDQKLNEIEIKRVGAYKEMTTLLDAMKSTTENLNTGTTKLVNALTTSQVRGRYGEISLRRVVEVAGMSPYCDFDEQLTVSTSDGKLRPDMAINLPGHRQLIIDSKVPLAAYMRAFDTDDESSRNVCMKEHAAAVRAHLKDLSGKAYWDQFPEAPDFVIMYLQIESSFGAALMADPSLIEDGINKQIVFATPSTLITMLRTVGFMWQQERMAQSVLQLRDAGMKLYQRTTVMLNHFVRVGSGLQTAVDSYNKSVGSLERNVITQLHRFKDIGGTLAKEEMPALKHIETTIKPVTKTVEATDADGIIDVMPE